ncbi:hypothetical protein FRB94_003918 [Tulasnella sp. JGI-2019a]|nr:hypothetical protein FRB93_009245 [Tulasnella sp. JGI-2019a]KAG9013085.1 hypothetical protein FRB94_003918 [Tulasnella sp. JGI-2019a]
MCYNIQNGRHHQGCNCFEAMDTSRHDCQMKNCIFSAYHPQNCASHNHCNRYMASPIKNAIRTSPYKCASCAAIERERVAVQAVNRPVGM